MDLLGSFWYLQLHEQVERLGPRSFTVQKQFLAHIVHTTGPGIILE